MYKDVEELRHHINDWYAGLLEEGWSMIAGAYPTFIRDNHFIEFEPVSFISPDELGLWYYKLENGKLSERYGMGSDTLFNCQFPILEFDELTFDVATLATSK